MADTVSNKLISKTSVRSPSILAGNGSQIVLFIAAHFLLGLIFRQFPAISTLHTYVAVLVGGIWALSKPPVYAAYASVYVVGSEVLWRMLNAQFFWEGGKYAVILILTLSIFRQRQKQIPVLPLLYFLFLLPSVFFTLAGVDLSDARELISFNLSGPLALFVSAWFFSTLKLNRTQLIAILVALVAPVITTAIYAILTTLSTANITWVNDSNFQTSGGFGPNQVSAIMGLGVVATWIIFLLWRGKVHSKVLLVLTGTALLIQGFLTFSRGGVLTAAIAVAFLSLHTVQDKKQRSRTIAYMIAGFALLIIFVLPALDNFTQGTLQTRYNDFGLSNRDTILADEIQVFIDNPVAGVGPGMGNRYREDSAAHTEITRLLAEHGMLGLGALLMLFTMFLQRYFTHKKPLSRGLYGSFILWSLVTMVHAAMRLAAVSFTFGLAFAEIVLDDSQQST